MGMMKPVKMQKVRIIGLKTVLQNLIRSLHETGVIEIRISDYNSVGLDGGRPLDVFNTISERLVRIRSIRTLLPHLEGVLPEHVDISSLINGDDRELVTLERELKTIVDESAKIDADLIRLQNELKVVDWLTVFSDIDFTHLETNTISYVAGELPSTRLEECKKKLEAISKYYNIRVESRESKEPNAAHNKATGKLHCLIIYKKGNFNIVDELAAFGFSRVVVPSEVTFSDKMKHLLLRQIDEKKKRVAELRISLHSLSKQYYKRILSIESMLSVESERAEVTSKFNFSKNIFVLEGWVREDSYHKLEKVIEAFSPKIIVSKIEAGHHELPPTVLNNPSYAKALEYITTTFSLPNSLELDPTMAYLITLPLFYGMIVGDVIYGIISFFLATWFLKNFKNEMLVNAARIWLLSAIPSVFFGLVFDEWLGVSHYYWIEVINQWLALLGIAIQASGPFYHGLSRLHELPQVMLLTILVGLLHLAIAFLLGAINEWEHNKKHAIAKLSWIGIEIGGTLTIAAFLFGVFPADMNELIGSMAVVFMTMSIIVLGLTEGLVGIIEIPGLMGNVLSYTRIALVGVGGVMLAEVINIFFTPVPSQGIFALITFPLLAILHSVNTLIVMFEALIQGGRLNIVEFRSKFLHGGGKQFEPFSMK